MARKEKKEKENIKNKRGALLVLSGFSGVGKGTVIRRLMETYPGCYTFSVSATTRSPRPGEQDGVDYFYISHEEFDRWVEEGRFLEHATYVSNSYGTPKFFVEEQREKGLTVILDIETNGAFQVREACPEARLIYLIPPSAETLKERLIGRGTENEEQIRNRLEKALAEAPVVPRFDYIVVNDDVAETAEEIRLLGEGSTVTRRSREESEKLTEEIAEDLAKILKERE